MTPGNRREVVLVTGASRGIGRSIALALARSGYDLVLWARTPGDLAAVCDEAELHGVEARAACVDVADPDAVREEERRSLHGLEGLRGLVLCAGIGSWQPIRETSDALWHSIHDTNLNGAFYTLKVALPLLERVPYSHVIVIGSDSSVSGMPDRAAYCSSKWALRGLAESLRAETRQSRIKTTQILASRVDTHFRGRQPGDRAEALQPEQVARVVLSVFAQDASVELREISMASMHASYGS